MIHYPPLQRLQQLFGGRIGQYLKAQRGWRTAWDWVVYNNEAIALLRQVLPYLVTKRAEAEAAQSAEHWRHPHYPRGGLLPRMIAEREELYQRLRTLKRYEFNEPRLKALQSGD